MNQRQILRRLDRARRYLDHLPARIIEYQNIALAIGNPDIDQEKLFQAICRLRQQAEKLSLASES